MIKTNSRSHLMDCEITFGCRDHLRVSRSPNCFKIKLLTYCGGFEITHGLRDRPTFLVTGFEITRGLRDRPCQLGFEITLCFWIMGFEIALNQYLNRIYIRIEMYVQNIQRLGQTMNSAHWLSWFGQVTQCYLKCHSEEYHWCHTLRHRTFQRMNGLNVDRTICP